MKLICASDPGLPRRLAMLAVAAWIVGWIAGQTFGGRSPW